MPRFALRRRTAIARRSGRFSKSVPFTRRLTPSIPRNAVSSVMRRANPPAVAKAFSMSGPRPTGWLQGLGQQIQVQMYYDGGTVFTTSTVAPTYFANSVTMALFSSAGYLGLFDQYRCDLVEFWYTPYNISDTAAFGTVSTAVDLDDATVPTTQNEVIHKAGAITTSAGMGHYHAFVPGIANALYGGAFTQFGNKKSNTQWIDSGSPGVIMYGMKGFAAPTTAAIPYHILVRGTYTFRAPAVS